MLVYGLIVLTAMKDVSIMIDGSQLVVEHEDAEVMRPIRTAVNLLNKEVVSMIIVIFQN
jgi:hypothetical protein